MPAWGWGLIASWVTLNVWVGWHIGFIEMFWEILTKKDEWL